MADKACFVISPIGLPDSDTKKRSDQVLKHIIKPAVNACGYTATRADEMSEPGLITSQVIQRIVDDPLVVADLTESNPNVFYEMALRHAVKKPLVQLIAKGERSVEATKQEMMHRSKQWSCQEPSSTLRSLSRWICKHYDTAISLRIVLWRT